MRETDRIELLKQLKGALEYYKTPCILRTPEEEPVPMPILTTLHREMGARQEDVMGEYYFLDIPRENNQAYYFQILLSITEHLPRENYELLKEAASVVNFFLPLGAFVLNQELGVLAFKTTVIIPEEYDQDQAFVLMDKSIGGGLDLVDRYVDAFLELEEGTFTLEQLWQLVRGAEN